MKQALTPFVFAVLSAGMAGAAFSAPASGPAQMAPAPAAKPPANVAPIPVPSVPASAPVSALLPMAIPIVQGYDSFGLSIPDLDETGRLRSLFVIGAVSRVDDRRVEIRDSFLESYALDGSKDFSIELPKATLDRFTRVLVANVPVTIRRQEFELHGDAMEFNTLTREGGLSGAIKMVIYNGIGGAKPAQRDPASPAGSTSLSIGSKTTEFTDPKPAPPAERGKAGQK